MAIRRSVVLTCDGPCGTVISDTRVPEGWAYVNVMPAHNTPGRKTPYKRAALCPECTKALYNSLGRLGYSFADVNVSVEGGQGGQGEGAQKPSSTTEPSGD